MKTVLVILGLLFLALTAQGCATRKVIVYEQAPPPAPRVEVITVRPRPAAVWVPGHWAWRGRYRGYVWAPGYWR